MIRTALILHMSQVAPHAARHATLLISTGCRRNQHLMYAPSCFPLKTHQAEEAIDSTPGNSLLEQSPSETIRGEDGRPGSRNVSDHNAGRKRKPAKKHSSLLKLIERSPSLKNLMGGRKTIEPSRSILKKGPKSRNRGSPGSGFEDCESVSSVKVRHIRD